MALSARVLCRCGDGADAAATEANPWKLMVLDTVVTRRCRVRLCVPRGGGAPSGTSVHTSSMQTKVAQNGVEPGVLAAGKGLTLGRLLKMRLRVVERLPGEAGLSGPGGDSAELRAVLRVGLLYGGETPLERLNLGEHGSFLGEHSGDGHGVHRRGGESELRGR